MGPAEADPDVVGTANDEVCDRAFFTGNDQGNIAGSGQKTGPECVTLSPPTTTTTTTTTVPVTTTTTTTVPVTTTTTAPETTATSTTMVGATTTTMPGGPTTQPGTPTTQPGLPATGNGWGKEMSAIGAGFVALGGLAMLAARRRPASH